MRLGSPNVLPWRIYGNRQKNKEIKSKNIQLHRETDTHWIKRNLSINGLKLQKELKGEICYPLKLTTQRKKNICTSRSFANEINEVKKLREAVSSHANTCAIKLRKEKSCCSTVGVFLNTNPFKSKAEQYYPYKMFRLDVPTNDSIEIVKFALKGLDQIYLPSYIYKKSNSRKDSSRVTGQLSLFDNLDRDKRRKVNSVIDKLIEWVGIKLNSSPRNRKEMG